MTLPGTEFERFYHQVRSRQKRLSLAVFVLVLVFYLSAGHMTEFNPVTIWNALPAFFGYLSDTLPALHVSSLFAGPDIKGSLAWWGYRLPVQLPLIVETLQIALASTLIAVTFSIPLAFLAASNTGSPLPLRVIIRTLVAFLRTMPDLAWAIIFVMAFGTGPFQGLLALLLHSTGSLTRLFYDAIESAQDKSIAGVMACGASSFQRARFALWPQVKPTILSFSLMSLEINFRSSTILGLVGAGGIGQELMTNIKLDRYDQVSMTLLLIIVVVCLIDSLSGFLRKKVLYGIRLPRKPVQDLPGSYYQHCAASLQKNYLYYIGLSVSACALYYIYFFLLYGIHFAQLSAGIHQIALYLQRMFLWQNFHDWPLRYYLYQIMITLAIVFTGTLTATLITLPLSFLASRNIMRGWLPGAMALLLRRLFDILRGIDMAIWGLIFVRAVGLGPLAGVLAIIMKDIGLLGKLYAESHEAVERGPGKGLEAVAASPLQKFRFGIFTQSFPAILALSLYQLESNVRSAAVLGFVGAGGVGLIYAENMRLWNWDVVMFITVMMVIIAMVLDTISAWLRRHYIEGHIVPLFKSGNPSCPKKR